MNDFVLYIHGANVRTQNYAARMDAFMKKKLGKKVVTSSVYWGDVSDAAEQRVLEQWKSSPIWRNLWFSDFRSKMLLQLIGDSAIYVSRSLGAEVVKRIFEATKTAFQDRSKGDRLHLVTHSWGAVILLDLLFASRWTEKDNPGYDDVHALRNALFGMGHETDKGVLLASVTTMGSPMSLFSLMDGSSNGFGSSSHDITGNIQDYCCKLFEERKIPLAWYNFVHPGDAFAYPSAPLLDSLLQEHAKTVHADDILVKLGAVDTIVRALTLKSVLSIFDAANAHNSYWENAQVIRSVAAGVKAASKR